MRKSILVAVTAGLLALGPVALAQDPLQGHGELTAAHQSIGVALERLRAAKTRGKEEFGGHRDRAEELLNEADKEIVQAAVYSNQHPK
jgi:hypothetical protein